MIRPIALKPAAQGSRTPRASQQRPLKATAEHARGSPLPPPPPHRWNSSEGLYQNIGAQVPTTQQSQRSAPLSDLGHNSLSCLPTASGGAPGAPSEAAPATPGKISASTGHIDHIAAPGAPTSTNLNQSGRKPQAMEVSIFRLLNLLGKQDQLGKQPNVIGNGIVNEIVSLLCKRSCFVICMD